MQSCSGGRPAFPSLALAISLSLTLQTVPATHDFDGQRQDCAAGSWGASILDRRVSSVAAVRLPCPMLPLWLQCVLTRRWAARASLRSGLLSYGEADDNCCSLK